ncbi:ribonuclease T2 [Dokdonella soli]|uniref:Ribonuclease T2 n=1 Tax=Dokdonella soli TaxID=529810 RepID=A0ABP3U466_9GAMM
MSRLRPALILAGLLALCFASSALARHSHSSRSREAQSNSDTVVGQYDYYVMALSWSPTFCETHPDEEDQCGHKGYGFVLHGLWPQYENGGGPQRCVSDAEPDGKTVAEALAFMPSKRLINHEWHTHGACTGLDPAGYFNAADRAFAAVHVPPELKAPQSAMQTTADDLRDALKRANPGLADDMLSLHCSQGELVEVRVCLDKNLALRSCGRRMRTGCPLSAPFSIPATR